MWHKDKGSLSLWHVLVAYIPPSSGREFTPKTLGCHWWGKVLLAMYTLSESIVLAENIFRKTTTTDTTIHFLSNHPLQQKTAACRFYVQKAYMLPLTQQDRWSELSTIMEVAQNNGFPAHMIQWLHEHITSNRKTYTKNTSTTHNSKWITFT
jgi:hypothetical protein